MDSLNKTSGAIQTGRFIGLTIELAQLGKVQLTKLLARNAETEVYLTHDPRIVVKLFDLNCGRADEVSYGPYMEFALEIANFDEIQNLAELKSFVPAYYGANIDYEKKHAYIAMQFLEGQDLTSWCAAGRENGFPPEWVASFREVMYQTLCIMRLFHKFGIILIDFKPDDILFSCEQGVKFVDMGAFFTPRHAEQSQKYVYSTTPDHAELVIDASNVPSGVALTEASDIFSAGVALFEMATGSSRLTIDPALADVILSMPEIYLFRNTQIKDVWRLNPELQEALPLLDTQLKERRILFSEFWLLLKAYLPYQKLEWESLQEGQQDQLVLADGMVLIQEQLPPPLRWLAEPIARSTVMRSVRLKEVAELMNLLALPIVEEIRLDLAEYNCLVQCLHDMDHAGDFIGYLNSWEVRINPESGHWAIGAPVAAVQLAENAPFTFLALTQRDEAGHRFYHIVDDLEADDYESGKLTVWHLQNDHHAWIGIEGKQMHSSHQCSVG